MEKDAEEALLILEASDAAASGAAAIVVMPDSGDFIRGNEAGMIQLAIACLRAARGRNQSFQDEDWVFSDDMDWGLQGLRYDADLTRQQCKRKPPGLVMQLFGWTFVMAVALIFVVGLHASFVGFIRLFSK